MLREELQERFDEITKELKEMPHYHHQYGKLWDERADIRRKMYDIDQAIKFPTQQTKTVK